MSARRAIAWSLLGLLVACSSEADLASSEGAVVVGKSVTIEQQVSIDLPEVSGLGLRRTQGRLELLAVGDALPQVAIANTSGATLGFDLRPAAGPRPSQWEAVTSDASARVFVLKESPGSIAVLDPSLQKAEAEIELAVSGKVWKDENSRGEGLVLLKNGHVLILKEKDPVLLVEFGPEGDRPSGYRAGAAVSPTDTFPVPAPDRRRYVPLKVWELGKDSGKRAEDASEICVGPDGLLYVLSDKSRTVSVVESELAPSEERFKFDVSWDLPKGIEKPEGLVILPSGRPVVAVDAPKAGKSVFVLSPLARGKSH